eukprot:scaffold2359_cov102-Cylindrotheca_fusiformis.AAC.5
MRAYMLASSCTLWVIADDMMFIVGNKQTHHGYKYVGDVSKIFINKRSRFLELDSAKRSFSKAPESYCHRHHSREI